MNNNNQVEYDNRLLERLEKQAQLANKWAAADEKKKNIYGIDFIFHINNKRDTQKTGYRLKTVQDLITLVNQEKNQANQGNQGQKVQANYLAFEHPDKDNILSHSILLKDVKEVYLKDVSSENMAYIHVFGKKNVCTYYVNKSTTQVEELIKQFNNDIENQGDIINIRNEKYGIGSRLEPLMQINDNIMKSAIQNYVEEGEGLIRILPY